jgi:hypothetical protein
MCPQWKLIFAGCISLFCVTAAIAHALDPSINIDSATMILIGIALLPWLGIFFRSIELPGGIRVEYDDVKQVENKAREAGLLPAKEMNAPISYPVYERIAVEDPNLALAGLRIEIEKELNALATRHGIDINIQSALSLTKELAKQNVIGADSYLAIGDLLRLLNKAVHGAKVDYKTVTEALKTGSQILQALRAK